jgi:hypothetical protein
MKPLALLFALASTAAAIPRINEVHANPAGTDAIGGTSYEYIEIISTTGGVESLAGCRLMLLDTDGGNMGRVDGLWDLGALSTGTNGLLLLGVNLTATGGGPWAGKIAPGTAIADIAIPPGKDGLIEPNRAWSLILVKNFTGAITVGVTDLSTNDTQLNLGVRNTLQDAVGLNEHRFNAEDEVPPTPTANLSQLTYSPGNVSRKLGNTTANSAAAWFGGEVVGSSPTSVAFDPTRRFGGIAFAAATPGQPNDPPEPADLRINEVSVNPAGTDGNHEFIELIKVGGEATTGQDYHLLVVNTDPTSDPTCGTDRSLGVIVEAWNLDGVEIGANGLALVGNGYDEEFSPWRNHADPATVLSDIGIATDPEAVKLGNNDIGNEVHLRELGICGLDRNNAGFSLLLVRGFSGAALQDLDTNDDGTLDVQPWSQLVDSVGYSAGAPTYAAVDLAQPGYQPDNLSRRAGNTTANSAAAFYGGTHEGVNPYHLGFGSQFFGGFRGQATPGRANLSAAAAPAPFALNEVNFAPPGDAAEFIELRSTGDRIAPTQGLSLVLTATDGSVLHAWGLDDFSTGPNGLLLLGDAFETQAATIFPAGTIRADSAVASGPAGFAAGGLPDDSFALLLVENFNGAADVDADNNGAVDPVHAVADGISLGGPTHPAVTSFPAQLEAGNVSRSGTQWYGGEIAGTAPGGLDFSSWFGPWQGTVTPGQGNHAASPSNGLVLLNELNINPPGEDGANDYVELIDTAISSRSLNGLTLVAIDTYPGADGLGNVGEISRVWNLDSLATGRNGLTLLGEGFAAGGPFAAAASPLTAMADPVGMNADALANNDGFALLLVRGFSGQGGQDLDAGNDDVLDATPWTDVVDAVAFGAFTYGFPSLNQGAFTPDNLSRGGRFADLVANSAARWYGGDLIGPNGTDTAYDPAEKFDNTGAVPAGSATPGQLNFGGVLDDEVDNDLDGRANIIELALVSDPDVPDAGGPVASTVEVAGQQHLALEFSRVKGGTGSTADYTAGGIRYVVQVSDELNSWTAAAAELVTLSVVDEGASERVTLRLADPVNPAEPRRFLRLIVTRP